MRDRLGPCLRSIRAVVVRVSCRSTSKSSNDSGATNLMSVAAMSPSNSRTAKFATGSWAENQHHEQHHVVNFTTAFA